MFLLTIKNRNGSSTIYSMILCRYLDTHLLTNTTWRQLSHFLTPYNSNISLQISQNFYSSKYSISGIGIQDSTTLKRGELSLNADDSMSIVSRTVNFVSQRNLLDGSSEAQGSKKGEMFGWRHFFGKRYHRLPNGATYYIGVNSEQDIRGRLADDR